MLRMQNSRYWEDGMPISSLRKHFKDLFNTDYAPVVYFSPGRVNLIGEHIDYNGGTVLPCAIGKGTYAAVAKNNLRELRVCSLNFSDKEIKIFSLDDLEYRKEDSWANFPKGIFKLIRKRFPQMNQGYDLVFYGTLPQGAGLSSSASVEVLVAFILANEEKLPLDRVEMALISQDVENRYIGLHSGIMDQFIIANGVANHAILLNCDTLVYNLIPLQLGDYHIIIMNSNKRRALTDSKYNERFEECRRALKILQGHFKITHLCELSLFQLNAKKSALHDEVLFRRARHVVTENERVTQAVHALENGDLEQFGQLMNQSHDSLRDDYEVSGENLDLLVSEARKQPSVLGARMTGAGFSGCAIALVHKDRIKEFSREVGQQYRKKMNIDAELYVVTPEQGVYCVQGN